MEVIADSQIAEKYGTHFIGIHSSGMYILKGSACVFFLNNSAI